MPFPKRLRPLVRVIVRTSISNYTFIDIKANTGYYTVMAGLTVGPIGRVHSFEYCGCTAKEWPCNKIASQE